MAVKRRRGVDEDEFYALRRWRSGDNRKHIHWRSTAKLGRPMVKQFDQKSNRDLALLVDLYVPDMESLDQMEFADFDGYPARCESALSFAATVFASLSGQVHYGIESVFCEQRSA